MVVRSNTKVIAAKGKIVTAGAIDAHVHFICPQQCPEALSNGITTLIGGGTGPIAGTNATTCTPSRTLIRNMLLAPNDVPLNILLTGKGNDLQQAGLKDQILSGVGGLKLHETPLKFVNRIGAVHPNILILTYQSKSKDLSLSFKVLLPVGNLLAYLPTTVFKNCLPILSCTSKTAPSDSSSLKSIELGTMSLSNSKRFSE
ncbi:hypothetical protein BY996DRAFT_6416818 [Phakopsora pachyrhizi]|nr:hypothetical protein BY996DRAFT_6416818 [Phakopsora pachyrhizi]